MPDKKVLWMLNQLEGFEKPKIKLEQYATSSELAVSMIEMINELVGLDGVKLVDVGCGCGMLMTTAATLYEPESVLGIDLDEDALKVCARNIEFADVQERCDVLQADVLDSETDLPRGTFDVAIINPPFGTKNNTGFKNELRRSTLTRTEHLLEGKKVVKMDFIKNAETAETNSAMDSIRPGSTSPN